MSLLMPPPAINKAVALASLADDFRTGAKLRTSDIAETYGVSRRTAQRYLLEIDLYLVPLERDAHCRWRMMRSLP